MLNATRIYGSSLRILPQGFALVSEISSQLLKLSGSLLRITGRGTYQGPLEVEAATNRVAFPSLRCESLEIYLLWFRGDERSGPLASLKGTEGRVEVLSEPMVEF